jgi:UPF0755 protein
MSERSEHIATDVDDGILPDDEWDDDWDGVDDGSDEDEYVYERLRRQSSGFRRVVMVLLSIVVLAVVVGGVVTVWVLRQIDPPGPPGAEIEVTVPTGSSTSAIATLLEDKGVIAHATVFRYYLRAKGAGSFQAGDFVFRENSSMGDALKVLEAGPALPPSQQFTVPPGLTLPEIAARIVEQLPNFSTDRMTEAIAGDTIRSRYMPAGVNLEGFLFPETYEVGEGQNEAATLAMMVAQFDAVAAQAGMDLLPQTFGLTPYQVVIIASLIEKEARIPEDQPKIARVIYNRLAQGIPLGIDAALCYGKEKPCTLTTADLETDTPYNTRLHTGLPPTPIAAPGEGALTAALNPVAGDWLYYVLDPNTPIEGDHFFTADYDEFLRVKADCEAAGLGCG